MEGHHWRIAKDYLEGAKSKKEKNSSK